MFKKIVLFGILFSLSFLVWGDVLRPALLELTETTPNQFQVLWKTPSISGVPLRVTPSLPGNCQEVSDTVQVREQDFSMTRWEVRCVGGLASRTITINDMNGLLTEVLVRIQYRDSPLQVGMLNALTPEYTLPENPGLIDTAMTYLKYGVFHILGGFDHLLFVLSLILLIPNKLQVVKAITAFTVSHSLTLGISALGLFRPPQAAIEAVIALSILFLAVELIKKYQGFRSLTANNPWVIAFAFGLLHGFGFAGALLETGLPPSDIPVALFFFNLGVESGQLIFIALAICTIELVKMLFSPRKGVQVAAHYVIGSVAAFWMVERVAAFWA